MAEELRRNWRTSLAGAVFAAATLIANSGDFSAEQRKWASVVATAAVGAGLMVARDHNK